MEHKKVIKYYSSFYEISKKLNQKQFYEFNMAIYGVLFYEEHIDSVEFKDPTLEIVWQSVKHSLASSIDGYCNRMKTEYKVVLEGVSKGLSKGVDKGLSNNEERRMKNEERRKKNEERRMKNTYTLETKDIPDEINILSFYEWLEYKKYKTQAPVTKCINMLKKYPKQVQQKMIDKSIMNGWKGLFEPKDTQAQKSLSRSQRNSEFIDNFFEQQKQDEIIGDVYE